MACISYNEKELHNFLYNLDYDENPDTEQPGLIQEVFNLGVPDEELPKYFLEHLKEKVNQKFIDNTGQSEEEVNAYISLISQDIYQLLHNENYPELQFDEFGDLQSGDFYHAIHPTASNKPKPAPTEDSKTDALDNPMQAKHDEANRRSFITENYRTSVGALRILRQNFTTGFNIAVLTGKRSFRSGINDINQGLREYQLELLDQVLDYLKPKIKDEALRDKLEHATMYTVENTESGQLLKYTGIMEELAEIPEIKYLLPKKYEGDTGDVTVDKLDNLAKFYSNSSSRIRLDAYNAYFILRHFDDIIREEFPEVEVIYTNKWNSFDLVGVVNQNKYKFGRLAHTATNWRDDNHDINAAEELSAPVKKIIQDIDIYKFGENGPQGKQRGRKMELSDFNRLTSIIKKMASTAFAHSSINRDLLKEIYTDPQYLNGEGDVKYKNLFDIVTDLNNDVAKNPKRFFKLITDSRFWDPKNGGFDKKGSIGLKTLSSLGLNTQDLDLLWSLYKGIFSENNSEAEGFSLFLKNLNTLDSTSQFNPYYFMCQTIATVESLQLQQYKVNEDGLIVNQTLKDNVNNGARRRMETNIASALSTLLPGSFTEKLSKYKIPGINSDDYLFTEYEDANHIYKKQFNLKVGNFTIEIHPDVNPTLGGITIHDNKSNTVLKDSSTKPNTTTFTRDDIAGLASFIEEFLGPLNLIENGQTSPILGYYLDYKSNDSSAIYDIVTMAAYVACNASIQSNVKNTVRNEVRESLLHTASNSAPYNATENYNALLKLYYGEDTPGFDKTSSELYTLINLYHVPALRDLVIANQVISGIYGDNIVRDSEGKSISQIGVSMLSTKMLELVKSLNLRRTSASRHFSLWRTEGLYRGEQFTREYAGRDDSTKATKFNTNEQFVSLFVYDFLGGLVVNESSQSEREKRRFVSIMPSILSDKSRILKLMLDFNAKVLFHGKKKALKDFTASEWKELARMDLGQFYTDIYLTTARTFNSLSSFMAENMDSILRRIEFDGGLELGSLVSSEFNGISNTDNFASFNKWFASLNQQVTVINAQIDAENAVIAAENITSEVKKSLKPRLKPLGIKDVMHSILVSFLSEYGDPLELTDQIQFTYGKNGLENNRLLVAQIVRSADNDGNVTLHTVNSEESMQKELGGFLEFLHNRGYYNIEKIDDEGYVYTDNEFDIFDDPLNPLGGWNSKYANSAEKLIKRIDEYNTTAKVPIAYDKYFGTTKSGKVILKLGEANSDLELEYTVPLAQIIGLTQMNEVENERKLDLKEGKQTHYITGERFWQIKSSDLIKDILSNGGIIETTSIAGKDLAQPELKLLKDLKGWIQSGTKSVVIAKLKSADGKKDHQIVTTDDLKGVYYKVGDRSIKATDDDFNFYDYIASEEAKKAGFVGFEINPLLDLWNSCDYTLSQEYMNSSVGTHLNHPSKKVKKFGRHKVGDLEEEAERWLAQVKRNVSLSASKHSFAMNMLNGIRDHYRIAVIEDDKRVVFNVKGLESPDGATPFDGATFVCGINNYLENYSLGGSMAGVDKKQFVHSYKESTGSGIIIKTAGFAITNQRILNSDFMERLNYKMMKGRWKTKKGKDFIPVSILKNFYGLDIPYDTIFQEIDGKFYQVRIEQLEDKSYRRFLTEVDEKGNDIGTELEEGQLLGGDEIIYNPQSNYDLWNMFGGAHSMSLQINDRTNERKMVYSEASFINLTKAVNSISEDLLYDKDGHITKYAESLSDVYLNLKHSNIDYVVTAGAIKQGAANINSNKAYWDRNFELTTMDIDMRDSGIQLDAEHQANQSTLSLMTQVVNALCARGYTLEESGEVYEAMLDLTRDSLSDYIEGLHKYFEVVEDGKPVGDSEALRDAIAKTIVKSLSRTSERDGNLAQAIAEEVVTAAKLGKNIKAKDLSGFIPTSHPAIFAQLSSAISASLTTRGIRIKFPGTLSVMNPSNGIYKMYGNRRKGELTKGMLERMLAEQKPLNAIAEIRLGYSYNVRKISTGELLEDGILIETPQDYWKFKEKYLGESVEITENVMKGRDLATSQFNFSNIEERSFNQWDLDSVKTLFWLNDDDNKGFVDEKFLDRLRLALTIYRDEDAAAKFLVKQETVHPGITIQYMENGRINRVKLADKIMSLLFSTIDEEGKTVYSGISFGKSLLRSAILNLVDLSGVKDVKQLISRFQRVLLSDLNAIGSGKGNRVIINGSTEVIDPDSTKVHDYEIIMSKIYQDLFLLEQGDSIADIYDKGSLFFLDKLIAKWYSTVSDDNFDIELKHSNGEHVYIVDRANGIPAGLTKVQLSETERGYTDDKYYRRDASGKDLYQLSGESDEIYRIGDNEVIVTNNVGFFINEGKFNNIRFSDRLINRDDFELKLSYLTTENGEPLDNKVVLSYWESLHHQEYIKKGEEEKPLDIKANALAYNKFHRATDTPVEKLLKLVHSKNRVSMPYALTNLVRNAEEMFSSFDQSLNILAARIPAQSFQSFMSMRVVGFEDTNLNSAYVNYWQIWLQGSDFDIDKVSLLGYQFSKSGKFVGWSNLFDLSTKETLLASTELPYPNKKTLKIITGEDHQIFDEIFGLLESLELGKLINSIFRKDGTAKKYISAEDIKLVAKLIKTLNAANGKLVIPENVSEEMLNRVKALKSLYDRHNAYITTSHSAKDAIMNFISSYMMKIGRNPANSILAQSSVDDLTNLVKKLAEKSASNTKTTRYAPGNVENKMETLILTLTGKDNTGIVASAMKTFEALSYYFNKKVGDIIKNANLGIPVKNADNILFNKSNGLIICGRLVNLLANTYTDLDISVLDKIGLDNVKQAILNVDNDTDAFLLVSALLSLSTDNAKDPTLSKINASPDMIGLYTAGLAVGIDMETLAHTIMSETGNAINTLLGGNAFNGVKSRRLNDALRYLNEGPKIEYASLDTLRKFTSAISAAFNEMSYKEKIYFLPKGIETKLKKQFKVEKTFELWLSDAKNYNLIADFNDQINTESEAEYQTSLLIESFLRAMNTKSFSFTGPQVLLILNHLISEGKMNKVSQIFYTVIHSTRDNIESTATAWKEANDAHKKLKESIKNTESSLEYINSLIDDWHDAETAAWELKNSNQRDLELVSYLSKLLREYRQYNRIFLRIHNEYLTNGGNPITVTTTNRYGLYLYTNYKESDVKRVNEAYLLRDRDGNLTGKAMRLKSISNEEEIKEYYKLSREERAKLPKPQFKDAVWEEVQVYSPWEAINTLNEINSEMGRLREDLSLNQGMPNTFAELLAAISKFRLKLNSRLDEVQNKGGLSEEMKEWIKEVKERYPEGVDLHMFLYPEKFIDTLKYNYQQQVIEDYEKIKCVFNVFDAVLTVPHYRGYLEALDAMYEAEKVNALIYRKVADYTPKVCEAYGYKGTKKITDTAKRLSKFFMNKLNNAFMQSINAYFTVSAGTEVFDIDGKITKVSEPTNIILGTEQGNASFKMWMELEVIPNLKRGNVHRFEEDANGNVIPVESLDYISEFTKALTPVKIDRTLSGNATVAYSLPISMMPRSDQETLQFKEYKSQFNLLSQQAYYYQYLDENGNTKQKGIPLLNLFFYYNLIVYGGEVNQKSFATLFEDLWRDGSLPLLELLRQFLANFDQYSDLIEGLDYDLSEALRWCAPITNNPTAYTKLPYIRYYDRSTMKYELYRYESDSLFSRGYDETEELGDLGLDDTEDFDDYGLSDDLSVEDFYDEEGSENYSSMSDLIWDPIKSNPNYVIDGYMDSELDDAFFLSHVKADHIEDSIMRLDGNSFIEFKKTNKGIVMTTLHKPNRMMVSYSLLRNQGIRETYPESESTFTVELLVKLQNSLMDQLAEETEDPIKKANLLARKVVASDFEIDDEPFSTGESNSMIPSRQLMLALINDIFNMCP